MYVQVFVFTAIFMTLHTIYDSLPSLEEDINLLGMDENLMYE